LNHEKENNLQELPPALNGQCHELNGRSDRIVYYRAAPASPASTTPLLLIHSINAAAGAHEVRPLFEHYSRERPVYAIDLPGYGRSDRSERAYLPRLMTDALHDMVEQIRADCGDIEVDALAVSLSSEFLARAAMETPDQFKTVALISPTGFNRREPLRGIPGSNRGISWVHRMLSLPGLGTGLFRLLTSRASVRFFLEKTWGSKQIDEPMFEYACLTTRQAGAHHAPFYFLSAFLFSADSGSVYEALPHPVWMTHGTRGDFTDYRLKDLFQQRMNWTCCEFEGGALPYFEMPAQFIAAYNQFLSTVTAPAKHSVQLPD
jgi:pimeloyl-ACP methyl ester carboxylesterase